MFIGKHLSKTKFYGALVILAGLCLSLVVLDLQKAQAVAPTIKPETSTATTPGLNRADYGKLPLLFEKNQGQTDQTAKFIARANAYTLYLAPTEAVFALKVPPSETNGANGQVPQEEVVRMKFAGANGHPTIKGENETITKTNYYLGQKRLLNVPNYERVNYSNLYDGIDAIFYGGPGNQLEYDFTIAPNADPGQIRLNFTGAENISVDEDGRLVIRTPNAELVQQAPIAYQEVGGQKRDVPSRFIIADDSKVRFELGAYDHAKPLVIDPRIGYLTYLGGTANDFVSSVKADAAGNLFLAGATRSANFPGPNPGGNKLFLAAFVSKLDADGQHLLYTTFLDGTDNDGVNSLNIQMIRPDIAIDANGNAYIAGGTDSEDFPVSAGAYQTSRGCERQYGQCIFPQEGFVTKLDPQGTMVYSTFLGGRNSDYLHSIAVDSSGRAYVTGGTYSGLTFPTKHQFQGTGIFGSQTLEAFLTVITADGSDILYSTGFGGSGSDQGNELALDASNNVYVVGTTSSTNSFPDRNAYQSVNGGGDDVFVAKFNTALSGDASLIYATMIGGSGGDRGHGIAVDSSGQAFITGITGSVNYPVPNGFRTVNQVNEAFVSQLSATGNVLVNSSFLGGENQDEGWDIALGVGGSIYVSGDTLSNFFPTALPFQSTNAGGRDVFFTKLKFGVGVISSSYLGGSGIDFQVRLAVQGNKIFLAGATGSSNLPTTLPVLQPIPGASSNNSDGFVAKIIDSRLDSVGVFRPGQVFLLTQSTTAVVSQQANLTAQLAGSRGVSGDWDGDGTDSIGSFSGGVWKVRDQNFPVVVLPSPFGAKTINFGASGDLPVVGDWNGDGIDTPGVFRPSTGQFTVTDSTATNPSFTASVTKVNFGLAGDRPIAGDWDGDGKDSVAVYRPSTGQTFFTNADVSVTSTGAITLNPGVDLTAFLGIAEDLPVGGDWNGDGIDSLGLWRPSTAQFFFSDDNGTLRPTFIFGQTGDQPIVGDWDGKP